jgi:hypothetical protein
VKAKYLTYDTSIDDYRQWYVAREQPPQELYEGVKVSDIEAVFDKDILAHFTAILNIFSREDLTGDDLNHCLKALQSLTNKDTFIKEAEAISVEGVRTSLMDIFEKFTAKKGSEMDSVMKKIENTTLGKLAKEIMDEVNIDEIQKSVEDGNILKSLSDPDGSLTKVLSSVSSKMIAKLASGELQQEDLLKDAMKLAGELGMPDGSGGMGGLNDMIKQMQRMGMGGPPQKPNTRHFRRKKEKKPPTI